MDDAKTRRGGWGHTGSENSEGPREDGRWSAPADEAPDRSPSDVGDEEREMRHPHPLGFR